jgi:hypothetical protein
MTTPEIGTSGFTTLFARLKAQHRATYPDLWI